MIRQTKLVLLNIAAAIVLLAALLALAYAANPSANLTIQVVPPSASAPLLGLYQGQGTSPLFHVWASRYPDFVLNLSFVEPGGEGSDPSGNGGYPVIVDFAMMGNSHCTSFAAAGSGACNGDYNTTLNNLIIPYASHIYAMRINSEWTQGINSYSPFANGCNARIDTATWINGVRNLVNTIRSHSELNNMKIELDAPQTGMEGYWPGDSYIDLTGFDRYFLSQFDGSSSNSWNIANSQTSPCFTNINVGASWGRAHGKPLLISEWCDTYTDGYILGQFANWMKDPFNNVVAQNYWDSNDAISTPAGCKLLDQSARESAYAAAFGGTAYTGSYWTLLSGATGNGY